MGFGLFLLDCETVSVNKLDQKKRLRLEKLDKVFFELQVDFQIIKVFCCAILRSRQVKKLEYLTT